VTPWKRCCFLHPLTRNLSVWRRSVCGITLLQQGVLTLFYMSFKTLWKGERIINTK